MEYTDDEKQLVAAYRQRRIENEAAAAEKATAATRQLDLHDIKGGMSPEDVALANAQILATLKGLGY